LQPPPKFLQLPPHNPSRHPPPSPPLKVQPLPVWIFFVLVQAFNWSFCGRKKEEGKEELNVILWLSMYLCCNSFGYTFTYAIR
jgi:hypothetical protein